MGKLATLNSLRQPRRTASTASALMIGLTLVTTVAVLGASASATVSASVRESLRGDLQVSSANFHPFAKRIGDEIEQLLDVEQLHRLRVSQVLFQEKPISITGMEQNSFDHIVAQTLVKGNLNSSAGTALLSQDFARDHSLYVGDDMELVASSGTQKVRVVGIFAPAEGVGRLAGDVVVDLTTFGSLSDASDYKLAIDIKDSADPEQVRSEIAELVADEPTVVVTDTEQWVEQVSERINNLLNLVYALLALAVVIAILGIVNTLSLAVLERTKELGLLRAVGFKSNQVRQMVILESVAIALLGSVLGIALGLILAISLQNLLQTEGLSQLDIPWLQLLAFLLLSALVGVIAAWIPARRAGKLEILAAIGED